MKRIIIGVAALAILTTACGGKDITAEWGGGDFPTTTAKPTVEYRDRRVNVPVEVEVAPAACLDALDIAEDIFDLSGEFAGAASDGFLAASRFDVDGIEDANDDFEAINDRLQPFIPRWQGARDDCKAAAE